MRRYVQNALLGLSVCILAACGGGEGGVVSQTSTGFSVEGGVAQKGALLKGSHVWIDELNPLTYAPAGYTYDLLTKDNAGRFDSSAINFTRQHIQTFAEGYYFNEITGAMANDSVLLQAQGDLTIDRLVNVNLLTTLAGPRLVALVTDKTKPATYRNFAAARTQAQKEVLAAFRIYNSTDLLPGGVDSTQKLVPANFSELDLSSNQSANQILAALSALAVKAGVNGVGISQFIANFQLDLADDGVINGSSGATSVRALIDTASATTDIMKTVATNLNTFYGTNTVSAAQLTPWVDSSGGTDQVIDKFKYTGAGVVGSETQSAGYTVGADDLGQCVWATGGKLYQNGKAVSGAAKAIANDVFKIGLTGTAAGAASGFIQRAAPLTSGACQSSLPDAGLTRIAKYTAQLSVTVGGTVAGLGSGVQVTLKNNGGDALTVSANGAFTFVTPLAANTAYAVTVGTQPTGQTCTVANASGTTGSLNVSNIAVTCSTTTLTVGGTVSGLAANTSVTLLNNGANALTVSANGAFVFTTPVAYNASYAVTVGTQPTATVCTVGNGTGTATTNISNVNILCSTNKVIKIMSGLGWPQGMAFDQTGNLYIADGSKNSIYKINSPSTPGSTYTSSVYLSHGTENTTGWGPTNIAFDKTGNMYFSAYDSFKIIKVTPSLVITEFASNIYDPEQMAFDASGNIFIVQNWSGIVDKVSPTGSVSTFVSPGYYFGSGLAIDHSGNIFSSGDTTDSTNKGFIKKTTATGITTTFATPSSGQGNLAFDPAENLYLPTPSGLFAYSPDGTVYQVALPSNFVVGGGVIFDSMGNLYNTSYQNTTNSGVFKLDLLPTSSTYKFDVTVPETSLPWYISANPTMTFNNGVGTPPISVSLQTNSINPGAIINVKCTSGTAYSAAQSQTTAVGCDGSINATVKGSHAGAPSFYIPKFSDTTNWVGNNLIASFANANGTIIGTPFIVNSKGVTVMAPHGATQLLIGVDDSYLPDNSGSMTVTIQH